jgi:hypothetical protein
MLPEQGAGIDLHPARGLQKAVATLSPGAAGSVFNPLVAAEFRRWRAKPLQYLSMVLVVFAGICYLYFNHQSLIQFPLTWSREVTLYFESLVRLLVRPSTILPLMMVWRAIVSFRDGGMYKPFRTTFLTPGEFLWGVIAVPFLLSGLLLVLYTGWVLGPGIIERHNVFAPDARNGHPLVLIAGILLEGSLNGAMICFIALYFGIRGEGRLTALMPVLALTLLVQALQAGLYVRSWEFLEFGRRFAAHRHGPLLVQLWPYLIQSAPKLVMAAAFWWATRRRLHRVEE